jgi:Glycosyl hydrolase catalytic core/F5/8 type C domain
MLIGLFAHTAMGQTNYVWNGTAGDWGTAANWLPNGVPGTNAGDTATIGNGGNPSIGNGITPITYTLARVTITNATGPVSGSTLTINASATLNVISNSITNVVLNGGNISNNGVLNITTANAAGGSNVPVGIGCGTPIQLPSVATEYGYSGNGSVDIDISGYSTSATTGTAVNLNATNANTSYRFIFGGASNVENTMTLNSAVVSYAFRIVGGVNASPLIIGGTGFTLGTGFGGLFILGGRSSVTINTGTTVTMNSDAANATTGISAYSGANIPVSFINKGTVNILGASTRSGISVSVENTGKSNFAPNVNFMNFENQGVLNIDMACSVASYAPLSVTASGTGQGNFNMLNTSTGLMTLKNTNATGSNIGSAIFVTAGGNIANVNFTNNGTLNLSGTNAVVGGQAGTAVLPRSQFINTGTITSNTNFNNWVISNSSTGSIVFTNPTAGASVLPFNGAFALNNGKIQTASGSTSLTNLRGVAAYSATSSIEPGGSGYGVADLGIIGTTPPAGTLKLQVDGNTAGVDHDQLNCTNGGVGYTSAPTITFAGGAGSGASGYVTVVGGAITAVTIVSGGSGYTTAPTVTASVGTGATLTATVSGGAVTGVSVVAGGTAYTANSNLTFGSAVTTAATASTTITSGSVDAINLLTGGSGYTTAPTVSFSTSGSTTSAAVTATISGGAVTGFNTVLSLSNLNLEITSLYTPSSSVSIPIVTTSGAGTISGNFASVTGLAPGWTISYTPTSVNLVYTVVIIPTIWTGSANNDFFNEANWRNSVTNLAPAANSINPGSNINLHLQINSASAVITSGAIQFGTGSLEVGSASLEATSLSGGTVTLNENGYINLTSATPLLNDVQINLTSGIGWVRTPNYKASDINNTNLGQIKVNGSSAVYTSNLRLDHYYLNGCVIRANLAATAPLTIYDNANRLGTSAAITVNTIHSGDAIANAMNNKMESFLLKKGFMVTIAIENDGTGKSKNFIASETDLIINVLPQTLQNTISFIRVMPWNWVTKKGFNAPVDSNLNVSWRYQWNPNQASTIDWEFAPMSWGHTSANDPADIQLLVDKYNSPYVMSFNEPDDCDGQSGQYGNLCQTDVAVGYHKNLMKTGMRIVSPGGREEAPKTGQWLEEFYNKATAQDIRVDVIAVHWYDWGSNPTVNTNPTAEQVFDRFKTYLTNVYDKFGLPIWITEFNANPARSQAINAGFLELALPYLESLDYIERYCWFPFNTNTHFTGWDEVNRVPTNTTPTLVGTIYKNINNTTPVNSSPSIPEATVNADNSLDLSNNPNVALNKPATSSSSWNGNVASNAVDGDTTSTSSRWLVEFASRPLPAWLEVDLQGSFTVDSFRIFEGSNAVRNFRFEVWDPTLNSGTGGWSTALTVANNPSTPLTTYRTITPVATTRVRLFITAPHNDSGYIRMFEFEVYGLKNNPTWTGGTSTAWTTAANWSTGIVPDQFSTVLIAGGAAFQPTISATTTINALGIAAGATLTVTAPNFTVRGAIDNDGTMTIGNNSNLLQGEEFNPNTGNVSITRSSSALQRLDYTIWSSPVETQNLAAFSPATSLNRFYNYNETTNLYNAVANPSTTAFGLAGGTLIRMPNTHPTTPTVWNGTFTGIPNNGSINRVVTYRNQTPFGFGYNMIGNPYPSTINANAFITENAAKIENTLYFWRKTNGAGGSAYATWNSATGGTVSAAGSEIPNGTIQVGQGFFVRAKPGTNPLATSFNQTLTFTNEMRQGNTSTQFFKIRQETKDRLWLNLTTATGVFSQALIGYLTDATLGVDDFDGKYINDSPIALTSNVNNEEYTIQSRPSFDPSDSVPLNFKTDVAGNYTIGLDHFDGVFANGQDVYLVDHTTGVEVDLKVASHTFAASAGVDNTRFTLKYQKTLKVGAPTFNENTVRVYKNSGILYVNSGAVAINNVKVFDLQGRLVAEQKNIKATTASIKDIKAVQQVLIVKITAEDGSLVAKKVLN